MRRAVWFVLVLIAIAAVLVLSFEIVGRGRQGAPSASETKPLEGLIVTAEPAMRDFTQRVPWTGVVQSISTVELVASTAGRVETIQAVDESPVRAGAVLMTLGGPLLASRKEKLQANVKSLHEQLALAGQNVKTIQQNVAQQLATTNDLTTAQTDELKLRAQWRDAQAELEALDLQTRILAPVSGVFTHRRVNIGQTVKEGDPLATVVDPNHLRIVASLFAPEQTVLQGKEASVWISAGRTLSGAVRRVLPQASDTGATQVWIEGPQIDEQLRPGRTTGGEVTAESRTSLAVPESAVVYGPQEQPYVFVQEQGRYERRDVRPGLAQDGWVEILAGLTMGQRVVTKGAYELLRREFTSQYRVED